MSTSVDFTDVSTAGLESSPHAEALAGLRANEARYFHTKYKHELAVAPAEDEPEALAWVEQILSSERDITFASRPLQVSVNEVDGTREGMDVPEELSAFKFARQKSKLAGTIRGSFFVIKQDHPY